MSTQQLPVTFTTLLLSMGSAAILAMGLEPHPETGKTEKDLHLAQFNIEMLKVLQLKTKNNLDADEQRFLNSLISDLQLKFVSATKN